jgi:hypothetical protein
MTEIQEHTYIEAYMTKYSLSVKNKLRNFVKSLVQQMNITLTRKYLFMPKR